MNSNDQTDLQDAHELMVKAHDWLNGLIIAGVAPRAAAAAMLTAVTERALLDGGQEKTVSFLKAQAALVERDGSEWLSALKARQ